MLMHALLPRFIGNLPGRQLEDGPILEHMPLFS
jgi:hypothetical protein